MKIYINFNKVVYLFKIYTQVKLTDVMLIFSFICQFP
jgi:hypothetical protein